MLLIYYYSSSRNRDTPLFRPFFLIALRVTNTDCSLHYIANICSSTDDLRVHMNNILIKLIIIMVVRCRHSMVGVWTGAYSFRWWRFWSSTLLCFSNILSRRFLQVSSLLQFAVLWYTLCAQASEAFCKQTRGPANVFAGTANYFGVNTIIVQMIAPIFLKAQNSGYQFNAAT
jgi:hypothetical protein